MEFLISAICLNLYSQNGVYLLSVEQLGYGLDNQGSIPSRGKIISLLHSIQIGSGPTQPLIQWVPGAL
jgi:hypothetical protein